MKNNDLLKDVRFANWNSWYTDLTDEIRKIKEVGNLVLFQPAKVNDYYSLIANLVSSVTWALSEPEQITNLLNKIEENIFGEKYIQSLEYNPKITSYQRKVIRMLREIFSRVCEDLSNHALIPKIDKKAKYNPNKAILGTQY